ncbi:MAG TPA: hypothetical protein VF077_05675 [Nitrospiraceae bacterium]
MLDRREKAAQFVFEQTGGKNAPETTKMNILQRGTRLYEYQHCIIEHNLEDANGTILNFRHTGTLDQLDPKIGGEIEDLIDAMHNPDEDLEDFPEPATNGFSSLTDSQAEAPVVTKP